MTQVSELIHQQGHARASHQCVAVDLGAIAAKWHTSAESSLFQASVIWMNLIWLFSLMRFAGMGKVKKKKKKEMHSEIYINWRLLRSNNSLLTSIILFSQICLLNIKTLIAKSSLLLAIPLLNHRRNKTHLLLLIWHPEALFHALIKCFGSSWCGHKNARVQFTLPSTPTRCPLPAAADFSCEMADDAPQYQIYWSHSQSQICQTPNMRQLPVTSGVFSCDWIPRQCLLVFEFRLVRSRTKKRLLYEVNWERASTKAHQLIWLPANICNGKKKGQRQ